MKEVFKDAWGDAALYAGMLAYLGDSESHDFLRDCLDGNGRLWRNPEACQKQQDYINSCSRDMFKGALLGMHTKQIIDLAIYLKNNNGLLCPRASDNRNKIGVMGWADLGLRLGKFASPNVMGWKGYILYHVFKYLVGFVTAMEALTVYEKYQLNLVYCSVMFMRIYNKNSVWDKVIMYILKVPRRCDEAPYEFLEGDLEKLESFRDHARDNRNKMLRNSYQHVADWPPNNGWLGHAYPSEVYCRWLEYAVEDLKAQRSGR